MILKRFAIIGLMLFTINNSFIYISFASGNVIYSTEEGGLWHHPDTWIEEVTPTGIDNVIINGSVELSNNDSNLEVNDLNITSNGSLDEGYYLQKA